MPRKSKVILAEESKVNMQSEVVQYVEESAEVINGKKVSSFKYFPALVVGVGQKEVEVNGEKTLEDCVNLIVFRDGLAVAVNEVLWGYGHSKVFRDIEEKSKVEETTEET